MIISALWLGTPVTIFDVIGCVLILVMVFLVTQRGDPSTSVRITYQDEDPSIFLGRAAVLGYYTSRVAQVEDYKAAMALLDEGHTIFAVLGIDEGLKKYPSARRLMRSIKNGSTYVIEVPDGRMIGMYAVSFSPNKQYDKPFSGEWLTGSAAPSHAYAELHWVCVTESARRSGVGRFILDSAEKVAREGDRASLRTDVYPENMPMRSLLEKYGYSECGTLIIKDYLGGQKTRIVVEKIL